MTVQIVTAAGGAAWEAALVTAFGSTGHELRIVRRCVDVVELLAVASAGQCRVALIDAGLRRLDADAVDRLLAVDVIAVGVVSRGDGAAEDRLRAIGVAHMVAADADPGVVASVVSVAALGTPVGPAAPTGRMFGDPSVSMAIPPGEAPPKPLDEPPSNGSVIAVWGPTGAPGRTTVAVNLADELGRLGSATLLVDADVYGGTISAALGLLDESPGLAAACRQASNTRIDAAGLAALSWQLGPRLRVLTGIPMAQRWTELRPAGVAAVLAAGRALADYTVVDCGFGLESDEELSFDTLAPRRNGATLAVLDAADVIVVVGAADPIGMQRLVRGLAELRDADVTTALWIVLNRVRRGVVPGNPAAQLTAALERFAGRSPAALLPLDQDSVDAALAAGHMLSEARPASPLRRSIAELAAALAGVPVAAGARRR